MRKGWLTLFLLFLLGGCSTKTSYYFLDWAIEWKVEEYVSLNDKQSALLEKALDDFLYWHRSQELMQYSQQLQQISNQLKQDTLTPTRWVQEVDQIKAHGYRAFKMLLPSMIPIITSLSDKQVMELLDNIEQDEIDLKEKYVDKSQQEVLEDEDKRLQKSFEKWLGHLSQPQKEAIHAFNRRSVLILPLWLEYRKTWATEFALTLEQRQNKALLTSRLITLVTESDKLKSVQYQKDLDINLVAFGELLLNIHGLASPQQKKRFNRKLDELIEDFAEMSQDI
ncbi:DUF6279 family lipoprotein [Shewanella surugensis]|uniref:DUF6279 family lipoprotein n=1 Tax=Shewanella surugensis TaxID=212020 RepID=A0ABT0L842_9GAMM|nr:DUF6279 family lipoprotein [Shewanella surugensis]MCL1123660.1 DUF6279 family lipoprotein [Shewanella surugensis]